jgi:hypothetical protein
MADRPEDAGADARSGRVEKFAKEFAEATTNEIRGKLLEDALDGATVGEFLQIHVDALRVTVGRVAELETRLSSERERADALARKVSLQSALLVNFHCH